MYFWFSLAPVDGFWVLAGLVWGLSFAGGGDAGLLAFALGQGLGAALMVGGRGSGVGGRGSGVGGRGSVPGSCC
jgi:hypothetical protein